MKDILDILDWRKRVARPAQDHVLATVVKTMGAAYRRPGARMLIVDGERTVGAISGGCLEQDIVEHAARLRNSPRPILIAYDSQQEKEIIWGAATGCGGVVWVLIENLSATFDYLSAVGAHLERRQTCVAATVIQCSSARARTGQHLVFATDLECVGDIEDPDLRAQLRADARAALASGKTSVKHYNAGDDPSATAEVLLEVISPPISLLIFGGGHDALPLVQFAKQLGWSVSVIDHRPAYADPSRFPPADQVVLSRPERVLEHVRTDERTAAVIMTHNFNLDAELLRQLLPTTIGYLGLLGASARTEQLLTYLRADERDEFASERRGRLYSPAGLNIHSETSAEVALSITAEIQAVMHGRSGGSLREHGQRIHN
ncbi:MAG: xanthine dehydrogenase accessory factor [Acidobacteriota bacterium]|jgi:xanthine/CO dehydrogenase XdhC/CoxF family maturation factor|nr:xanthine dehydrogenase accessory factor [Acidobacteriota bacterium]